MKGDHIGALKQLAIMGALNSFTEVTSRRLGESIGVSQQAASKEMQKLAELKLIERQIGQKGQKLIITKTGQMLLKREYLEYKLLFEPSKDLQIHGSVFSGLGEGRYYISQQRYKQQFTKKLMFTPYEGTLNIRVAAADMPLFETLTYSDGILIEGFVSKGRTFGDVKCFLGTIQGVDCSVIIPVRTHYSDVMEVIASRYLRDYLSVKDGDIVEVNVSLG